MATNDRGEPPRAMIHKRILDSAESDPDASMERLAAEVAGASPALVERVLDEYGDPGQSADAPEDAPTMTDHATTGEELSAKQEAALRAIAEHPAATQAEIADQLGVSRATVNKRVNAIEGFEWTDRKAFVEEFLGEPATTAAESSTEPEPAAPTNQPAVDGGQLLDADSEQAVEQLQERLARLEQRLGDAADLSALEDTELRAKVARAVLAAEDISEDEELRVLEALF